MGYIWDICLYVSAITLLEFNGLLKQKNIKKKEKPGWLIEAETKMEAIRKDLSRIDVVLKCKEKRQFTKKQKNIEKQFKKRFGKTTKENLLDNQMQIKQELKSETEKVRRRKTLDERRKLIIDLAKSQSLFIASFEKPPV